MEALYYLGFLFIGLFLGYLIGYFIKKDIDNDVTEKSFSFGSGLEKEMNFSIKEVEKAFNSYKKWKVRNDDYNNLNEVDEILDQLSKGIHSGLIDNYDMGIDIIIDGDNSTQELKILRRSKK